MQYNPLKNAENKHLSCCKRWFRWVDTFTLSLTPSLPLFPSLKWSHINCDNKFRSFHLLFQIDNNTHDGPRNGEGGRHFFDDIPTIICNGKLIIKSNNSNKITKQQPVITASAPSTNNNDDDNMMMLFWSCIFICVSDSLSFHAIFHVIKFIIVQIQRWNEDKRSLIYASCVHRTHSAEREKVKKTQCSLMQC